MSLSLGTTSLTRPNCSASWASNTLPVMIMSMARPSPIIRGNRTVKPSTRGTLKRPVENTELGVVCGDSQVTPGGKLKTAGYTPAVDSCDGGFEDIYPSGVTP